MRWRVLNMQEIVACPDIFSQLQNIAEVVSLPASQQLLDQQLPEFDAYYASLHVRVNRQTLERAPRLRVIATPSTGLDHIDLAAAKQHNVAVLSLRDDPELLDQITATAEMTWALLLAVVRRLPWAMNAALSGDWARDRFRGNQLSGKTLGILGYGRLGRMVAEYGKAFRMRVLACDIRPVVPAAGIEIVDLPQLLAESDVLSIHVHLAEENRGLLNRAAFSKIKQGAILLNTSRGGIVDEPALLEALSSGRLAGAGLDVISGEWDASLPDHPLLRYANQHQNVVITPHVGGATFESQRMALQRTADKLANFLEHAHGTQ